MKILKVLLTLIQVGFKTILIVMLPVAAFIVITMKTATIPNLKSFVVVSGSMEPTVPIGSVVFMRKASAYNVNDVIAFQNQDRTITHRIIGKVQKADGTYYKTQGDANSIADADLVNDKQIIGKGWFQIQYIGVAILWMRTLPGFLALIILPITVFISLEIWNIKKEIEKETEKKVLKRLQLNGNPPAFAR